MSDSPKLKIRNEEPIKKVSSEELFGNARVVLIEHEAATYRLFITRRGKLILNK